MAFLETLNGKLTKKDGTVIENVPEHMKGKIIRKYDKNGSSLVLQSKAAFTQITSCDFGNSILLSVFINEIARNDRIIFLAIPKTNKNQ